MKNEELSEAITEGIDKSLPVTILKMLILGVVIFEIIFIGAFFYDEYLTQKWEKEMCGEGYSTQVATQSCFPLENLVCEVIIGNDTSDFWATGYFQVCGYAEANAYFEQIKPRIEIEVKEDRILYKRNSRIKYLECR